MLDTREQPYLSSSETDRLGNGGELAESYDKSVRVMGTISVTSQNDFMRLWKYNNQIMFEKYMLGKQDLSGWSLGNLCNICTPKNI